MLLRQFLFLSCVYFCSLVAAGNNIERIEKLEGLVEDILKELREKTVRITQLEGKVQLQSRRIEALEQTVKDQAHLIKYLQDDQGISVKDNPQQVKSSVAQDEDKLRQRTKHKKNESLIFSNKQKETRIRRAENENPVAFLAALTGHMTQLGSMQNIAFDTIINNVGGAYNPHIGAFIAPVPGIYVFSVTLLAHDSNANHFALLKNSAVITRLYHNAETYEGTSMTVTLELEAGDDVSVANVDLNRAVHGDTYSSFTGFLLQQYYSTDSSVVG